MTTSWKPPETYALVAQVFGSEQEILAKESVLSVVERLRYCAYHFQEVIRLGKAFERKLKGSPSVIFAFAKPKVRDAFERYIVKAGAHSVAAVQSIHAIPDIFAHAVYFATAQNLEARPLKDRAIDFNAVVGRLERDARFRSVSPCLAAVAVGDDWDYLAAVSNLGKHRSVVRSQLNEDFTGTRAKYRELQLMGFSREGVTHLPRSLEKHLEPEFTRMNRAIAATITELNDGLRRLAI